jgi:hypothetical protein
MYEEDHIESDFASRRQNPFKTPDSYFESLEDRIMDNIKSNTKKKSYSGQIIRFLKPALGLAASLTLVYMLAYKPINSFLLKGDVKTVITDSTGNDPLNDYSLNLSSMDENSLIDAIFTDEANMLTETNPDEFLAYLSSGLNEVEIYSEIQK